MRNFDKFAKVVDGYNAEGENLVENMGTDGYNFVRGGGLGISYFDAENDLRKVYGESFDKDVYYTKKGDLRWRNGEPYIWTVYANKFGKALEEMRKKEK